MGIGIFLAMVGRDHGDTARNGGECGAAGDALDGGAVAGFGDMHHGEDGAGQAAGHFAQLQDGLVGTVGTGHGFSIEKGQEWIENDQCRAGLVDMGEELA